MIKDYQGIFLKETIFNAGKVSDILFKKSSFCTFLRNPLHWLSVFDHVLAFTNVNFSSVSLPWEISLPHPLKFMPGSLTCFGQLNMNRSDTCHFQAEGFHGESSGL